MTPEVRDDRYQLVLIRPEGFVFVESFREVMESLQAAFDELGIACESSINEIENGTIPILFGAHHLHPDAIDRLPPETIIYNMEQLLPGYPWYSDDYMALMGRFRVWDTHASNVAALRQVGISHAIHLPVGYMPLLSRIQPQTEDVDVLFYGVLTPHRSAILERISQLGINVTVLNGVFGLERDAWIARAKLVLNLHQTPGGLLETPRLAYLLANRKAVVSESGLNNQNEGYDEAIALATINEIPQLCRSLLDDKTARESLATRGFLEIASPHRRTTPMLADALLNAYSPVSDFLGKRGRDSGVDHTSPIKHNPRAVEFGVNLIGHLRGNLGLSVVARGIARSLLQRGEPVSLVDVSTIHGGTTSPPDLEPYFVTAQTDLRHPINLYVMPANFEWLFNGAPWLENSLHLHIGCVWWETTVVPDAWAASLGRLDAILANSTFIADVCARALPFTPVISGQQPISLPAIVRPERVRFGLANTDTVFVTSFDPNSDPMRKNPLAAILAFCAAFPDASENVRLIVRVSHADAPGLAEGTVSALREAAAGDARIQLLVSPMSHEEVLTLYSSCDVFVSLHRSEGLGLGLMEAMALGKPVIATGWSGNMSYMNYKNSCPVRYHLIPVKGNHPSYQASLLGQTALWAEPLLEDAVAWMRMLHASPERRGEIGRLAMADIDNYQQSAWTAGWVDEVMAMWHARNVLPRIAGKIST
jgi:glycosyltransferase involved in cell wall biosynthesis